MIERELTKAELKKREEIAKDLPDADFKKRYGADWMSVKMATATKMAKNEMKEAIGPKNASDAGEYDYEGAMAINDLKNIARSAQELIGMLDAKTNLPEWCQSKITKADDYIVSVRDYLKSENEQVEKPKSKMESLQDIRKRVKKLIG